MKHSQNRLSTQDKISHRILNTLLPLMLVLFTVLLVVAVVDPEGEMDRILTSAILVFSVAGVMVLNKRGRVRSATHTYVILSTIALLVGMFYGGGVFAPAFSATTGIVVMVGILYEDRKALGYMAGLFLTSLGVLLLQLRGIVEAEVAVRPLEVWSLHLGYAVAAFYIVFTSTKMLRATLTENEEAVREQQRNSQFMRTILNSMKEALITLDSEGVVCQVNKMAEDLLACRKEEAVQQKMCNLISIEYPDGKAYSFASLNSAYGLVEEVVVHRNDGKQLRVHISQNELIDEGGNAQGLVLVLYDITSHAQLKAKLSEQSKVHSLGLLAQGAAHDFNNMLSGIMVASELLKNDVNEKQAQLVDVIRNSAESATAVVQQMLSHTKKKKGFVSFDVNGLVADTLLFLSRTLDRSIAIVDDLQAYEPYVFGDAGQLQNALINMAINSSEVMPQGGSLTVTTALLTLDEKGCKSLGGMVQPGDYVAINMHDTGSGIAPEHIQKVFDPGFSTKEEGKGFGLGLAIAHSMVELHQGAITVNSSRKKGTLFTLYLPLQDKEELARPQPSVAPSGHGELVLVVDDEEAIRLTAKLLLEGLGYRVLTAKGAQEALVVIAQEDVSVVVVDMVMPGMNGRELFEKIHESHPGVPIILSTGILKEKELGEMLRKGLSGYLKKPYSSSDLNEVIARALS